MNDFLMCDICGKESEDVQTCIDPYSKGINNEDAVMDLCEICYQDRCADI